MTETPRYPYVHLDVPAEDAELIGYELFEAGALGHRRARRDDV